jgi:integrase
VRAKGEGTVYQRKDGRWVATLYDDRGQRRALYGRTEREVLAKRRKAQREGLPSGRPITVAAWLEQWVAALATRPLRKSTTDDYASKARRITKALGRHRLDRLTAAQIERAYADWLAEGLSPGMVKNLHRVLHACLQTAWRRDLIVKNPAALVEPPAPRPKPGVALTVDQARAVLAEAAQRPMGVRWWLALLLGMRQGEVLGLQWNHVDLDGGALMVVRDNAKTTSSARVLPLAPVLVSMLGELPRTSEFMFPSARGGRRDSKADWNEWQQLLAWCNLPRIRVHDCRHTTPTLLMELGVPARVVSEILGHATVGMTLNVYTHVPDPMVRSALDQLTARLTA